MTVNNHSKYIFNVAGTVSLVYGIVVYSGNGYSGRLVLILETNSFRV